MGENKDKQDSQSTPSPPRTIADYGGRRKIFERRLKKAPADQKERRSGEDRRSGFDRRSATENKNDNDGEKREHPVD